MKKDNVILLIYGFKLFILGYRLDFAQKKLERMTERRLRKNKQLSDPHLIKVSNKHYTYAKQWNELETKFISLKGEQN